MPKTKRSGGDTSVEEYLAAATALYDMATLMMSEGKVDAGKILLRDGALLAVAAEANLRRQEYVWADIENTKFYMENGHRVAEILIDKEYVKTDETRVGIVLDPRALSLLEQVIGDRVSGPVFAKADGSRLTEDGIYESLRRSTRRTLGIETCPNALRDAGASTTTDPEEMGSRLGNNKKTAAKNYRRPMYLIGLDLVRTSSLVDTPAAV